MMMLRSTFSSCRRYARHSPALYRAMLTSSASASQPPRDKTAWQPEHNIDIQRVTQTAIIHELTQQQVHTIETTVPWFLNEMPASYFRQVPETFRMDHLKAISAIKDANMDLHLNLQAHLPDGRAVLTRIRPGTKPGTLLNMVKELPGTTQEFDDYIPLSRVQVFSAKDDSMSLNIFVFGEERLAPTDIEENSKILEYAQQVQEGKFLNDERHPKPSPLFNRENIIDYLHHCSETYVNALSRVDPRRFLRQMKLFDSVSGSEGMAVFVEESDESPGEYWIDIAVANSLPQVALENAAHLLYLHKFDISSAHLDVVKDGENGDVTLLRILAAPISPDIIQEDTFQILRRELKRTKWLDPTTMDLVFDRYPWLGVSRGEIITAICSLMHPIMAKQNALAFSKANIINTVTTERYIPYAAAIADLFLERFEPRHHLSDEQLAVRSEELRMKIDRDVEDSSASELLNMMIDIVHYTLRTNIYLYDRYALGLRLDPRVLELEGDNRDVPYGVLFVHGRNFNGYHVRFRDIARGGMRLVTPANAELVALESARQYDECYGLAYAQQLKNKDIPEGGSKAVCLVNAVGLSQPGKNYVMRKSVKAFTDTILDLIVETDETKEQRVDFLGKEEVLYLGPDEQVIPDDINWIVKRAAKRGYKTPNAFMSSKPRAGINHKEYGVTSEGVNVYLDVALRRQFLIDPTKEPFTVKMTGGPDGDVAGNLIKILFRDYGDNCKIVGIADHSGCAEDPEGLSHDELLRLVSEDLNISNFDLAKLGSEGKLHLVDTEEGVVARNTMHNRLQADAFIPAGGRPNTIDMSNYQHFLRSDGTPSSPLIVEGANLFVTSLAREQLFRDAGVAIVKDSSANKAGVITSSYEICAAMLLTEEEFFENKEAIVAEVLQKLRDMAAMEAKLLFREFENYRGSLPHVSQVISDTINLATDAITAALDELSEDDMDALMSLFKAHLPKTIADIAFDRVKDAVPEQYIKNAIASCLASKLVYKEGTKFIESQPVDRLAKIAFEYVSKESEIAALKDALVDADVPQPEKQRILDLLEAGGARTALNIF